MKHHSTCVECPKHKRCKRPCKEVERLLWAENRVMERHYSNHIVVYNQKNHVHFSAITAGQDYDYDEETSLKKKQTPNTFTYDDVADLFRRDDYRLRKTTVFVERFFNKTPCAVLADRFGVKENTIIKMYQQAVEQLERIIEILDSRKQGIKAMKGQKFSDEQKWFLLAHCFGFSQIEVARMFNRDKDTINRRVKRFSDRYGALFDEAGKQ